mmetsp:Transcript_10786/g.12072  ORF Transcript_10786/g.12072 Transcript_10786/m.12072 type:complete len:299 (-) Transcript_10786:305-1201(-)
MHDGSISAVAEIEQLVEKASDGSLYIINERMLCQFPCAAKLKAIKHLSGNTSCTSGADSSTEACMQSVLEAEVMKAAMAIQDPSAQEAVIMLLSLVKLALKTCGITKKAKPAKEPEPLKPCVPRTLQGTTLASKSPHGRMPEDHKWSASGIKHDIIPSECQPVNLPLWLKIGNKVASSDTGVSKQKQTSDTTPCSIPTSDRRPPPLMRPADMTKSQYKESSIKGLADGVLQNGLSGSTMLRHELGSRFLLSSWTVSTMHSLMESRESDADYDEKGTLANSEAAVASLQELLELGPEEY